jgi:hypothetical protein
VPGSAARAGGAVGSVGRAGGGGPCRKPPGGMRCGPVGVRPASAVHRGRGSSTGRPGSSGPRRGSSPSRGPSPSGPVGRNPSLIPLRVEVSSGPGWRGGSGGRLAGSSPDSDGGERCSRKKSSRSVTASILTACPWSPPVNSVVCGRSSSSLRFLCLGERGRLRGRRQGVVLRHRVGATERRPGSEYPDQRPRRLPRHGR